MSEVTTLQEELQKFNDVPYTKKDKEEQMLYAWVREYDERMERIMIDSIVRMGVIEGCKL